MESELSTTNRLSRQSSSSSVLLPVDTVPLRLETPTGIDELTNEEENCQIDKLTQSLQKMATLQDGEIEPYYGICAKCGTEIVGECSAVKAMDKVYHKCCFLCVECLQELDNKPFYNVKGKVFCEKDYLVINHICINVLSRISKYYMFCLGTWITRDSRDLQRMSSSNHGHCKRSNKYIF